MGNPVNVFDIAGEDLATFLASSISDGTWADVFTTEKVDENLPSTEATAIETNVGALWGNAVDDFIKAAYPILRSVTVGPILLAGAETGDGAAGADELVIGDGSGAFGATVFTSNATSGSLRFTDTAGTYQGAVYYDHSTDSLGLYAGGAARASVASTGIHPAATATYDLGLTGTRWRTAYLSASVTVPVLTGGDFGTGTGAGTALVVTAGDGGTTGGAGATLTLRGGDAQAAAGGGGPLALRSGNSDGATDAPNITMASGTSGSGDVGVVQITNTCLEIAEAAAMPGPAIAAGFGRFGVRNDAPTRPIFEDDAGETHTMALVGQFTGFQNFTWLSDETVTNGLASVNLSAGGLAFPTVLGEITASDWVDYTGAAAGTPPTINGYSFSAVAGEGATIGIRVVTVDLNTTGSTVGDRWLLMLRTTTAGDVIFAKVEMI